MRLGISLIEVDYGKFYENVVKKLVSNGIKNIHVDFCEKNFSGRRISGTFSQVVAGGGVNVNLRYKNW